MKEIAVLGSTGSIGKQTLQVIRKHRDIFHVSVLAAHHDIDLLEEQAEEFRPTVIAVSDEEAGEVLRKRYTGKARILTGEKALEQSISVSGADVVLVAVVGISGLAPTLEAIREGRTVALANKETMVTGGELVTRAAAEKGVAILPVDSEHSAIFQSLLGQDAKRLHRILLTASGGPFRGLMRDELEHVRPADCMKHPTWNMGKKVTMDSATMFNKGLEIMEAHWLFGVDYDRICVLIQPQSIVHSMVEYEDGSIIAQLGNPDMRIPIQFALTYPHRLPSPSGVFLDWTEISAIYFEKPDPSVFRSIPMAYEAGKAGGDAGTVYNAANEECVSAFLKGQISFLSIFDSVEEVLDGWSVRPVSSVEDILYADAEARRKASEAIRRRCV